MKSRQLTAFFVLVTALGFSTSAATALAAPGTCKCNSGCHANAGQCLRPSSCNLGYAPSCGYRDGSGTASCPNVDYISCSGDCTCVPIPNFCENVGGAEYCDAGVPDSGTPRVDAQATDGSGTTDASSDGAASDAHVTAESGSAQDSSTTADGAATPAEDAVTTSDAAQGPDGVVGEDVGATPADDAAAHTDADEAPDTGLVNDAGAPWTPAEDALGAPDALGVDDAGSPSTCVPAACPSGTNAVALPGECDPFCAQPCQLNEFRCLTGFQCVAGFCVPQCVVTGCTSCQSCSLGGGECFTDDQLCPVADGGAVDGSLVSDAAAGSRDSTTPGNVVPGGATGSGRDASIGGLDGGATSLDGSAGEDGTGGGGCGCRVPRSPDTSPAGSVGLLSLLVGLVLRRRRAR